MMEKILIEIVNKEFTPSPTQNTTITSLAMKYTFQAKNIIVAMNKAKELTKDYYRSTIAPSVAVIHKVYNLKIVTSIPNQYTIGLRIDVTLKDGVDSNNLGTYDRAGGYTNKKAINTLKKCDNILRRNLK